MYSVCVIVPVCSLLFTLFYNIICIVGVIAILVSSSFNACTSSLACAIVFTFSMGYLFLSTEFEFAVAYFCDQS